jgi:hypothetical protein
MTHLHGTGELVPVEVLQSFVAFSAHGGAGSLLRVRRLVPVHMNGASTKRPLLRTFLPYVTDLVCGIPCIIYS